MHTKLLTYSILAIFGFILQCNGQYFSGKVYDEFGNPLAGANVYFDATNVGTVTGKTGEFEIQIPKTENNLLVISYLGYETLYLTSFKNNNQNYVLQPKENKLEEVIITESIFSREELLKVFKREFLGTNKNGRSCTITNEDAIRIKFDPNSMTISAFSNEDLVIINDRLNYKIRFNLIDFEAQLTYKSLERNYLRQSYFVGTSFFENHKKLKSKHQKRRKKAYLGSIQHFFKALYNSKIQENEFSVSKNGFGVSPTEVFKVEKKKNVATLNLGKSDALKDAKVYQQIGKEVPYFVRISLLYKNKEQTDIKFTIDKINFDQFGNYSPIAHVVLIGEMAKNKLGGMLPSNYKF